MVLNEASEMKNCNNCVYFENRKHQDLYMWLSRCPNGPSVKFLVQNGTACLSLPFFYEWNVL
jgi:ribosome biogenesis protein BRX1